MNKPVVLYDACVLYPAPLRDTLVSLAVTKTFRARWTEAIHEEWIGNLLGNRPDLTREQLDRTRRLMNKAVPDSVVTGYEALIETLTLPDPDDRHVLAAAIHAKARVLLTFNAKDFPDTGMSLYGIALRTPDAFITSLVDRHPLKVVAALAKQRGRLVNPPQTVPEFLETLERQALPQAVGRLRHYAASL